MRLRLLMERQHRIEIGQRIRELRENSTETNRSIADYCDVGERSVAAWVAGEGIAYKNAKKVAQLFSVDIDWLWRGGEARTAPDLMGALNGSQLNRIESKLDALLEWAETGEIEAAEGRLPEQGEAEAAQAGH